MFLVDENVSSVCLIVVWVLRGLGRDRDWREWRLCRLVRRIAGWSFGFGLSDFRVWKLGTGEGAEFSRRCFETVTAGTTLFKPESLILAQNERWRQA